MAYNKTIAGFEQAFGYRPDRLFFAPGRVNIIGEHLDYNSGHVMPAALEMGTYAAIGPGRPGSIRLYSDARPADGIIACPLDGLEDYKGPSWARYPIGILHGLGQMGAVLRPMDIFFYSDLPLEAGLSSSASIMVATALAGTAFLEMSLDKIAIARLVLRTEQDFIGLSCGIMDPYCSLFGRQGEAVLIDCDAGTHSYVPLTLGPYALLIAHTGKPRQLVGSLFDNRAESCREALRLVQTRRPELRHLCALNPGELPGLEGLFTGHPEAYRRMRHVVEENARVRLAAEAFMSGDIERLGALFAQSHRSLREDYEVSCPELDTFVDCLLTAGGVAAARMTGAGFGGCIVAIARREKIEDIIATAGARYREKTGLIPQFYSGKAGDGAREITEQKGQESL